MKYKVTFKWTEEVTTARQLILEADNKQHAEDLVNDSVEPQGEWDNKKIEIDKNDCYGINNGYRDEIGIEISKDFYGDAGCFFSIEETKV